MSKKPKILHQTVQDFWRHICCTISVSITSHSHLEFSIFELKKQIIYNIDTGVR